MQDFEEAYKKLNKEQKSAVDTLDGPVMVVAGPGTGKTQVLALRICNILKKTDTKADSVLCLTFTRAGVEAMQNRLRTYIGNDAQNVTINTFHSFANTLVEKYFEVLDFTYPPKLMDDTESVFLIDEILHNHDWKYIKERKDPSQYFGDLKGLISLLKKERLPPERFLELIDREIASLKDDPSSISSRGARKGELKKEILNKIESLSRTKEVVKFYEIYESEKHDRGIMDYDDVLEYLVKIVEESEDVRADIMETYQYILIDEHQDSSFIQNNFLKAVWGDVELPNIFVVGDDRQLIYGFSGASLSYFEEFAHYFGKAKLITLTENYRSTENILALADSLLASSITKDKLKSNNKKNLKVNLHEYNFPRDEILHIGAMIKNLHEKGEDLNDFAILVPKNRNVSRACHILEDMGIPTVAEKSISLFDLPESESIVRVLKIINNPNDNVSLVESLLDHTSGIEVFKAHKFIKSFKRPDEITIDQLISGTENENLFSSTNPISLWGNMLLSWMKISQNERISKTVSIIGNELLIEKSKDHEYLLRNVEVVRSFIHLAIAYEEKNPKSKMKDFVAYIARLIEYHTHMNVASIGLSIGVNVMTLHRAKGLEYKYVFIAHMNEEILMSSKSSAFSLPESMKELLAKKDVETAKRELYVAITRAKEECFISYAKSDESGRNLTLAYIVNDLDKNHFQFKDSIETEKEILKNGVEHFAKKPMVDKESSTLKDVKDFVKQKYPETKISSTLLNNFFECPWRWYFNNFLKLPGIKSKSLALGSAVHSTIEFILKAPKLPDEKDIKEKIISELVREGVDRDVDMKRLGEDGFLAIDGWVKYDYKNIAKDYKTERPISFKDKNFPNLNMYGKVDLTERLEDGSIVVTDFKTGHSKTSGVIEKLDDEHRLSGYMRQLAMYSYLIRGAENKDVSESRLLFLEEKPDDKNYIYKTHVSDEEIDLLVRDIRDYESLLVNGDWVDRRCDFKSYGAKNTKCEYCDLASKIF